MKERPILFNGAMVRALLAGTKTQTRRVANKLVRHPDLGNLYKPGALVLEKEPQHIIERACPYGQPGDRLWVREAWAVHPVFDKRAPRDIDAPVTYAADHPPAGILVGKGRPSIHMPRWASRITLEVTGVRVEHLQDISEADALAEGIVHQPDGGYGLDDTTHYHYTDPLLSYFSLWEAINGDGSVMVNPWIWAVEFRRLP